MGGQGPVLGGSLVAIRGVTSKVSDNSLKPTLGPNEPPSLVPKRGMHVAWLANVSITYQDPARANGHSSFWKLSGRTLLPKLLTTSSRQPSAEASKTCPALNILELSTRRRIFHCSIL